MKPEVYRVGGRIYGFTRGDGILRKVADKKKGHAIRIIGVRGGWGLDDGLLAWARQRGIRTIIVHEQSELRDYEVSLSEFDKKSKPFDKGYGAQHALPFEDWQVTEREPERENRQLSLF